jgi:hypothetical protein
MASRAKTQGIPALLLTSLWGAGAVGCLAQVGDPDDPPQVRVDGGGAADAGVSGDAGVADGGAGPVVVADVPLLTTSTRCVALAPGARALGVSPEGHLWLGTSTTGATQVRVLDGWAPGVEGAYRLAVQDLQRVQAWTATAASFIADGRLYHAVDGLRTEISVTATLSPDATLCGDPTAQAFVYSDGALFQRDEDTWYRWSGVEAALTPDARLLTRDGACWGMDDGVWFASADLELWQLGATELSRPARLEGASQPVLLNDAPLALRGGHLFVGPAPWTEYAFEAGPATGLAAAGDYAWLRAGQSILRFDGAAFVEVQGVQGDLLPHASGGLWAVSGAEACHLAPQVMLRVDGLQGGTQREAEAFALRVQASDEAAGVEVALDGAALSPARESDGWLVYRGRLALGWHALRVTAGGAARTVTVKRVPSVVRSYAADIAPIYRTHCAACHVPASPFGAPDLSTLEAWRALASKIHERAVVDGDMPPRASRLPEWGEDEITVIDEWLSGGLQP